MMPLTAIILIKARLLERLLASGVHSIPASVKYFTPILLICLIYEPLIRLVLVYPFFL